MSNAYCDRLGITPPRLLDAASREWPNYLDLMVFTLLARGGQLLLDEMVGALSPLWTGSPASLRTSLQKAWAGREPIVKHADGSLALDFESVRLAPVLVRLQFRAPPPRPPGPPEFVPPGPVGGRLDPLNSGFLGLLDPVSLLSESGSRPERKGDLDPLGASDSRPALDPPLGVFRPGA